MEWQKPAFRWLLSGLPPRAIAAEALLRRSLRA